MHTWFLYRILLYTSVRISNKKVYMIIGVLKEVKPNEHDNPIFIKKGIVHYCVTNMPAVVSRSSTIALTRVTLPFGLMIAKLVPVAETYSCQRQRSKSIQRACCLQKFGNKFRSQV